MTNKMKIIAAVGVVAMLFFGVVFSQEAVTKVSGELSTDVTFGDEVTFGSPYTGLSFSGEGWKLTSNLSDGNVTVEEASYELDTGAGVTLTLGQQRVPFGTGVAWHRPSVNPFVSAPSSVTYNTGVGASVSVVGVGVEAFLGSDSLYSTRFSYSVVGHTMGVSYNNDEALLIDVTGGWSLSGVSGKSYFEYDLSEETSGNFWYRSVISHPSAIGISLLLGYSSITTDDVAETSMLYGVGYDFGGSSFSTEFSDDSDVVVRVSYTF